MIQYRHSVGIKSIFTDLEGTRVAFIDDHNQGFVYMPVSLDMFTKVKISKLSSFSSASKKRSQFPIFQSKQLESCGTIHILRCLLFLTEKFAQLSYSFDIQLMENMCGKLERLNC